MLLCLPYPEFSQLSYCEALDFIITNLQSSKEACHSNATYVKNQGSEGKAVCISSAGRITGVLEQETDSPSSFFLTITPSLQHSITPAHYVEDASFSVCVAKLALVELLNEIH